MSVRRSATHGAVGFLVCMCVCGYLPSINWAGKIFPDSNVFRCFSHQLEHAAALGLCRVRGNVCRVGRVTYICKVG